jgi:hypothetical protein
LCAAKPAGCILENLKEIMNSVRKMIAKTRKSNMCNKSNDKYKENEKNIGL